MIFISTIGPAAGFCEAAVWNPALFPEACYGVRGA